MMATAAPNAGMGLFNLGACGALLPSSQPNSNPGHGFLIPRRSIPVLPLSWGLVRRRVHDGRTSGFGAAGALASGEAGAGSSELRHIEKELTFSPTFTDYVKFMESVKLDRSKSLQGGDLDGRSSRRRFMDNGDASSVRRVDRGLAHPRNKSFERKMGAQRDRESEEGRGVKLVNNDSQKKDTGFVEKRMLGGAENSNDGQGKVGEYVQRRIVRGELGKIGDNVDKSDHKHFTSYLNTKDNRGSMAVHQSTGNKHAQSDARKDLRGRATSVVRRTSVPEDNIIILKNTKSMVNRGQVDFASARSSINEHDFKYPRERKFSNNEFNADSKFQDTRKE